MRYFLTPSCFKEATFVNGIPALCPICGGAMWPSFFNDCLTCPEHGRMSAITFVESIGLQKHEAIANVRAEQYKDEIRRMVDQFKEAA